MSQIHNDPAEFATALHEGRITECLATIEALDSQLEGRRARSPKRTRRVKNASKEAPQRAGRARKTAPESSLARHARKCSICNHPDREAIEADFINWRSEETISYEFSLSSRTSIYRHAAATGLLRKRRLNLRGVCERIIERAEEAPPSAASILRALRIFAQITEDGQWIEPPKRSIVTHIVVNQDAPTAGASVVPASRRQPSPIAGHRQACHSERSEESRRGCSAVNPESEPAIRRSPAHPIVSSSAVDARECSEIPSSLCFSEKIGNNIHKHNNLPPHGAPEILIGTQNHSPEDSTS